MKTLTGIITAAAMACSGTLIAQPRIFNHDSIWFEQPDSYISMSNNTWQIGKPGKADFNSAYSGMNVIITDTANLVAPGTHVWFDLKLTGYKKIISYGNSYLIFKHRYHTDSLSGCYIEASADNGRTFHDILKARDYHALYATTTNFYDTSSLLYNGMPGFTGNSGDWQESRINITWLILAKKMPADTLIYRFHYISDSNATATEGWMIDNIYLSTEERSGGLSQAETAGNIHVYPNPGHGTVYVEIDGRTATPYTMRMFTSAGACMLEEKVAGSEPIAIDTHNYDKGIYYLVFTGQGQSTCVKKLLIR